MAEDVGGNQASVAFDDSGLDPNLARLRSSIQQLEAELQILQRQMQQSTGASRAMADTLDMLSSAHARLTDRATTMATATHQVHTGLDDVGKASNSAAMEMMDVGRYADDMQNGLGSIVNQVPQVAMAMGAGAGLAGGLSVATVATNQLIMRWDDLADTFRDNKTIAAAEGMENLGKATSRTAEEASRLAKLKREPQQARTLRDIADTEATQALLAEGGQGEPVGESQVTEARETSLDRIAGEQGNRNAAPTASLQDRLAHLTQVEQRGGSTFDGSAYEPSTKAATGEDSQLRKLQDISKTLEEIRKLSAGSKTIGVKRRR